MRIRSAVLGLCVGVAGCSGEPEGRESASAAWTGETEASSSGSTVGSSGWVDPTTGETGGTDATGAASEPSTVTNASTGDGTTGGSGGTTESADETTGGATTVGEETTTGGPPADCPRVRVLTPNDVLNVRPTPSTAMEPVGVLANGTIVDVVAVVAGEVLDGNGTWYQIESDAVAGFVWGGLVECTTDEPFDGEFYLPLACGMQATISQGNNGGFSHTGQSAYAFDFSLGIGTPLVAIADGTVLAVYGETGPGDPCYDGGGQECINEANYVVLAHSDGTQSIYAHLSATSVVKDEFVARGAEVGLTGSTGWSTGPHAHVAREEGCGGAWCQSIAVQFADVPDGGVPETGDVVVSGNCP
jgi:hypothetical protein